MDREKFPQGFTDVNGQQVDLRRENSWTLRLHQVSTAELAEVMSINLMAPTILNARLKGLMERTGTPAGRGVNGGPLNVSKQCVLCLCLVSYFVIFCLVASYVYYIHVKALAPNYHTNLNTHAHTYIY